MAAPQVHTPPPAAAGDATAPQATRSSRSSSRGRRWEHPDPDGLEEFSVVYTERALNHMSTKFQQVMRDVSASFKNVYNAHSTALVPGGGTFAMEAAARQFGTGQKCLVIRNGYFSYRWSQIFESCSIPSKEVVLSAQPLEHGRVPAYAPRGLDEVVEIISRERPGVVFAPHVETSSGIMLPDAYMKEVADAVHAVGGLFVLDCIASGCIWVDMEAVGVDVLISAPQKGWSGSPCAGIVMLSASARRRLDETVSTSFAADLRKWVAVMEAYEKGGHMYHATMPTDSIAQLRDIQKEMAERGFEQLRREQLYLGRDVRRLLAAHGFKSVAAEGWQAPSVVVSYTDDPELKSGAKFAALGMQTAAGVPLMVDEFTQSPQFSTFRIGLFGLDKLGGAAEAVARLERALQAVASASSAPAARL